MLTLMTSEMEDPIEITEDGTPAEAPPVVEPEKPAEEVKEPETAETPEEKASEESDDKEDEHSKRRGGFQRKIARLEAEARELAEKLAKYEKPEPEQNRKVTGKEPEGKPKVENFDTYEAYTEALTDWKLDQREATRQRESQAKEIEAGWHKRLAAASEKYEDFHEAMETEVVLSPTMQELILESEAGAEIAYWLAKNPKDAASILSLSPMAQVRRLVSIEHEIAGREKPATTEKPRASKAPPPIPRSNGTVKVEFDVAKSTPAEYEKWRANGGGRAN